MKKNNATYWDYKTRPIECSSVGVFNEFSEIVSVIVKNTIQKDQWKTSETYLEPCQASTMELLKMVKTFQSFTIFAKGSILDICLGSECTSAIENLAFPPGI